MVSRAPSGCPQENRSRGQDCPGRGLWEAVRKMVRLKLHLKSLQDLEMGSMYDSNLVLHVKMLLSSFIEILTLRTLGL